MLIATVALDMVAGPGETATIKNANPIEMSDRISVIIFLDIYIYTAKAPKQWLAKICNELKLTQIGPFHFK